MTLANVKRNPSLLTTVFFYSTNISKESGKVGGEPSSCLHLYEDTAMLRSASTRSDPRGSSLMAASTASAANRARAIAAG